MTRAGPQGTLDRDHSELSIPAAMHAAGRGANQAFTGCRGRRMTMICDDAD